MSTRDHAIAALTAMKASGDIIDFSIDADGFSILTDQGWTPREDFYSFGYLGSNDTLED